MKHCELKTVFWFVLLVYWEGGGDEKAYSADGNGADQRLAEKGGNLVSKFTDLQELGLVRREGGNYNGLPRRLAVIDWLMASAPGQRITFFGPNSGTQCPPQTPLPQCDHDHLHFATFTFVTITFAFSLSLSYFYFFYFHFLWIHKHNPFDDHDPPPLVNYPAIRLCFRWKSSHCLSDTACPLAIRLMSTKEGKEGRVHQQM